MSASNKAASAAETPTTKPRPPIPAHADRTDLLNWLGHFASPPKQLFLTHGEADAANELAQQVQRRFSWSTAVPEYLDVVDLD